MKKFLWFLALMLVACGGGEVDEVEEVGVLAEEVVVVEGNVGDDMGFVAEVVEAEVVELFRFNDMFFEVFDTITNFIGYTQGQEEFVYFSRDVVLPELMRLHRLFDRYESYEGINNIRTINENAGVSPVEVDPVVIEVLNFSIEAYHASNGVVNVMIGPLTDLWRTVISGERDTVPSMAELQAAAAFMDISGLIIDEENNTVFLEQVGMSLDVGGIAKGYATELAARYVRERGLDSFILSVGGDVVLGDGPVGGNRDTWNVGVTDPFGSGGNVDVLNVINTAVFSSGDYQRFVMIDGVRYHHIINPRTLMPASDFRGTTIIHPHGGMADVLATAAFVLELDEAMDVVVRAGGEGLWILPDGSFRMTDGYGYFSSTQ
ncbi:MAG: FAD:protein FMN transferase [Turicibacter sp.]|nr:FAD:protein FMN transferase [Turicibacter sp.]